MFGFLFLIKKFFAFRRPNEWLTDENQNLINPLKETFSKFCSVNYKRNFKFSLIFVFRNVKLHVHPQIYVLICNSLLINNHLY